MKTEKLDKQPLVSISCIAYNHEKYIRDAIEGFLMQKTTFPFEILIHDDASTDSTAEIIREYEKKHPNLIFPVYQTENQYSKGVMISPKFNWPRARGKYIALCEGDDYWTDRNKLQKQVDFLEENEEYALCVSGFKRLESDLDINDVIVIPSEVSPNETGYSFTLDHTAINWLTKTLTAVFRNDSEVLTKLTQYKYGRDINLFYHILKTGKGFYFTEITGTYRIHEGGVNSMKHGEINSNVAYRVYKELHIINKDKWTRKMRFFHILALFNYNLFNKYPGNNFKFSARIYIEAVFLIHSFKEIKFLLTALLPTNFKNKFRK